MPTIPISMSGRAPTRAAAPVELRTSATVRLPIMLISLGSLLLPIAVHAADPKPVRPDGDLLEFLGNDDVDPELQDYLGSRDAGKPDDAKPSPQPGTGKT